MSAYDKPNFESLLYEEKYQKVWKNITKNIFFMFVICVFANNWAI